jgi:hypothetical protein
MDYNSLTDDYPYSVLLARPGECEESAKGIKIAQQLQQEQPDSRCRTRSNTPDLPMDGHETKVRRLQAFDVGSRCQRGQIPISDHPPPHDETACTPRSACASATASPSTCLITILQLDFLCGFPFLLAGGSSAAITQVGRLALRARDGNVKKAELASRCR